MAEIKIFTINSKADSLPLSVLYAYAENPKAILQLCHGMTEHKERYIPFMTFMADNGYNCYIHDMRGHGASVLSPEDLGYFYENGSKACIDDLLTINEYIRANHPELPIYMFGHSMGSLEVRTYAKYHDDTISGLIISGSPSWVSAIPAGKILIKLLKAIKGERYRSALMDGMVSGAYNKPYAHESSSSHNWISKNPDNVIAYDTNPLCGFTFTLNGFSTLMNLMTETYSKTGWKMSNSRLPIYFISGGSDPCRGKEKDFEKSVQNMKNVGYTDVSVKLFPGLRHELLNEKNPERIHADILNRLDYWYVKHTLDKK